MTKHGIFKAYCYRSKLDETEYIALVKRKIGNGEDVLVRVHSECLTDDIFGSSQCYCGNQLDLAMRLREEPEEEWWCTYEGTKGEGSGWVTSFTITGSGFFNLILVSNVDGSGDVAAMAVMKEEKG
ncbi:unnamed protein product [Linum trigynum]|uniref:Expansin n=1 Tax=Linum trigynum TaxID=586398 RepID=A0AAV2E919_9ROSI